MALRKGFDDLNSEITEWSKETKEYLVDEMDALGIQHSKNSTSRLPLRKALKVTVRKRFGNIDRISFSVPRHSIFLAKGVSRGHGIDNPRQAKDWYNPVIKNRLPGLEDIVVEQTGNALINNWSI